LSFTLSKMPEFDIVGDEVNDKVAHTGFATVEQEITETTEA